eukprot:1171742-Amorphochlora_amoeboformis.AAC.1
MGTRLPSVWGTSTRSKPVTRYPKLLGGGPRPLFSSLRYIYISHILYHHTGYLKVRGSIPLGMGSVLFERRERGRARHVTFAKVIFTNTS